MGYQLRRRKIPGRLILLAPVVVLEGVAEGSTRCSPPTLLEVALRNEKVAERARKVVNLAQFPLKSVLAPSLSFSAEPAVPALQEA